MKVLFAQRVENVHERILWKLSFKIKRFCNQTQNCYNQPYYFVIQNDVKEQQSKANNEEGSPSKTNQKRHRETQTNSSVDAENRSTSDKAIPGPSTSKVFEY